MTNKVLITVAFTLNESDLRGVYDDLFEGEVPTGVGDVFSSILESTLFDPDNSDVNLMGAFLIIGVGDVPE